MTEQQPDVPSADPPPRIYLPGDPEPGPEVALVASIRPGITGGPWRPLGAALWQCGCPWCVEPHAVPLQRAWRALLVADGPMVALDGPAP